MEEINYSYFVGLLMGWTIGPFLMAWGGIVIYEKLKKRKVLKVLINISSRLQSSGLME